MKKNIHLLLSFLLITAIHTSVITSPLDHASLHKKEEAENQLQNIVILLMNFIIRNQYVPQAEQLSDEIKQEIIHDILNDKDITEVVILIIENRILLESLFSKNNQYQKLLQKGRNGSFIINCISSLSVSILAIFDMLLDANKANQFTTPAKIAFGAMGLTTLLDMYFTAYKLQLEGEYNNLSNIEKMQESDKEQVNQIIARKICAALQKAIDNTL